MKVDRPSLRYFGGKFRLSRWILSYFPEHICFVEPFGGAAGVLLNKRPSQQEVYNDLDGEVVNFFRVLREQTEALVQAIKLTPYAREEQTQSFSKAEEITDLERARRLYVRCWQSHGGGRTQWRTGWRYEIGNTRGKRIIDDWNETNHLWNIAARFKVVQIEHDSALRVIERFDSKDTLFYCDPPYLPETRSQRWRRKAYTCEMDIADHQALLELLVKVNGMVIISGKPSQLYDEYLGAWETASCDMPTDFQSVTHEIIWMNRQTVEHMKQMRLFSDFYEAT